MSMPSTATAAPTTPASAPRELYGSSLQVQRDELASVKDGRTVYVRRSGLFFKTTRADALEHNAAAQKAAADAAAAEKPDR